MKYFILPIASLILFAISVIGIYTEFNSADNISASDLADNLSPWIVLSGVSSVIFWVSIIYVIYISLKKKFVSKNK